MATCSLGANFERAGTTILDANDIPADRNAAADLPVRLQRAEGEIRLSARVDAGRTRLHRLHQRGSSKALMPGGDGAGLTAVLLNTAGGVTGGDSFQIRADAGPDTLVTLTTQASERGYRARPGETGQIETHLTVRAGATVHWLPQETILYDGAALARKLDVSLKEDATLLAVESFILGRAAHHETVRDLRLSDHWRVRRGGRLVYADAVRMHGDPSDLSAGPATLGGCRAFASIVLVAPDADRHLPPLRSALTPLQNSRSGAGLIRDGVLAARIVAPDGFALRKTLIPALECLRGAKLPRPWSI